MPPGEPRGNEQFALGITKGIQVARCDGSLDQSASSLRRIQVGVWVAGDSVPVVGMWRVIATDVDQGFSAGAKPAVETVQIGLGVEWKVIRSPDDGLILFLHRGTQRRERFGREVMGFDHFTQDAHSPRTGFGTLRFARSIGIGKVRFASTETWNP